MGIYKVDGDFFMKKFLVKILIGSISFMVFLVVGVQNFAVKSKTKVSKTNQAKSLITRNGSGHYTRTTSPYNKNKEGSSNSRIIYIGESTEGLLD